MIISGLLILRPGDITITRRPYARPERTKPAGPRINENIRALQVLLVDQDGKKRGEVPIETALEAARQAGKDLVEVSANHDVPVCKIVDYGKMRYEAQKKKAASRKKQKTSELKEIKLRPNIDTHDYEVKVKKISKFFEQGDKVKITLRFRGREMAHQHLGMELLARVKQDFSTQMKIELEPKLEGRQMTMVMAPR